VFTFKMNRARSLIRAIALILACNFPGSIMSMVVSVKRAIVTKRASSIAMRVLRMAMKNWLIQLTVSLVPLFVDNCELALIFHILCEKIHCTIFQLAPTLDKR